MKILGLETTERRATVALLDNCEVVVDMTLDDEARSASLLAPGIHLALKQAQWQATDLDRIAVTVGPGSFTGLRIALSAAKGLCLAADKVLVTVSTLETLAARLPFARLPVCAVLDARKREVYTALYDTTEGVPVERIGPRAILPTQLAEERAGQPTIFTGDGAEVYRDLLGPNAQIAPSFCARPDAGTIGWLALSKLERGETVDIDSVEPEYVRPPDAIPLSRK